MSYELYWISGSPYAWMAMLAMEIKGLSYTSRRLDPGKREQKASAYLAINPRGKVPALKDGDTVICESIAILAYLDRLHPEPPLFGATARDTGLVWERVSEIQDYSQEPINDGIVQPIFRGKAAESAAAIREALPVAREALAWGEEILGSSAYLAGQSVSAADVVYLPLIARLVRALGREDAMAGLGSCRSRRPIPTLPRGLRAWRLCRGMARRFRRTGKRELAGLVRPLLSPRTACLVRSACSGHASVRQTRCRIQPKR